MTNRGRAFDANVMKAAQSDECWVDISTKPRRSEATYAPASPMSARRRDTSSMTPYVGLLKMFLISEDPILTMYPLPTRVYS